MASAMTHISSSSVASSYASLLEVIFLDPFRNMLMAHEAHYQRDTDHGNFQTLRWKSQL